MPIIIIIFSARILEITLPFGGMGIAMRNYFISLFITLTLLLSACQPLQQSSATASDFNTLTDELFSASVTSDSLTLNYTLSNPAAYSIDDLPQGFSCLSQEQEKKNNMETENIRQRLHTIDKQSLSTKNKILYDTLEDTLQQQLSYEKCTSLATALNPSSGIQAQLPVLLSEFTIEDMSDLSQYFALLNSLPAYFQSLIEWEQEKIQTNTVLCQATWQHIIVQCQDFIYKDGKKAIQHRFEEQLQTLTQIDIDKEKILKKHTKLLQEKVLPAYQNMIRQCQKLKEQAPSDGALAAYPNGKTYYEYLFRQKTGSSDTVLHWQSRLTKKLLQAEKTLLTITAKNPAILRTSEERLPVSETPATLLTSLYRKMQADFPSCQQTSCQIRYVDSSLEDYLSPAFYLVPPIDRTDNNTIYINNASKYRHTSLYNTLAHEGYPGHLYQNCYLRGQNLPPLRYILDYPGYTEGYATYAEIYAYRYTGGSKDEITVLQQNAIASHCLYALCDIGIHYEHWSLEKLKHFLAKHGIYTEETATILYETIIDSPGSYLPYTIGYWEIEQLKNYYFRLHSNATDKDFHTYLLNMGPTSFAILKKYCIE